MNIDNITDKIYNALTKSKLLSLNINDISMTMISKNTFDILLKNKPIGVRVNYNEQNNDFAVSLSYDTNRVKNKSKTIDPSKMLDDAIEDYLNATQV